MKSLVNQLDSHGTKIKRGHILLDEAFIKANGAFHTDHQWKKGYSRINHILQFFGAHRGSAAILEYYSGYINI